MVSTIERFLRLMQAQSLKVLQGYSQALLKMTSTIARFLRFMHAQNLKVL